MLVKRIYIYIYIFAFDVLAYLNNFLSIPFLKTGCKCRDGTGTIGLVTTLLIECWFRAQKIAFISKWLPFQRLCKVYCLSMIIIRTH